MSSLANMLKRVNSVGPKTLCQRASNKFKESQEEELKQPSVFIIIIGQDDETTTQVLELLDVNVFKHLQEQFSKELGIGLFVVDLRVGKSSLSYESFLEIIEFLQQRCQQHLFFFVVLLSDKPIQPRVPKEIPGKTFENIANDHGFKKMYQIDTNCIPYVYRLCDGNRISLDPNLSTSKEFQLLLRSDIECQVDYVLSFPNTKERVFANFVSKSLKKSATTCKIKTRLEDKLPSKNVICLNSIHIDSSDYQKIRELLMPSIMNAIDRHPKITTKKKHDVHFNTACNLHPIFAGRNNHAEKILNYIRMNNNKSALIVYGGSGYGKSSVLVNVLKRVESEIGKNVVVIYRFIGLTDDTKMAEDLILSIYSQLVELLPSIEKSVPSFSNQETPCDKMNKLLSVVANAALKKNKKIVIALDDLSDLGQAKSKLLKWIPETIPCPINLIFCMDSSKTGLLDSVLQKLSISKDHLIRVDTLYEEEAIEIVQHHCSTKKRKLTRDQINTISTAFFHCRQVKYLYMLLDQSLNWRSFDEVRSLRIGRTVRMIIQIMFEDLEKRLGGDIVARALSLLVCSKDFDYVVHKRYLSTESTKRRIHSILATYFIKTNRLLKKVDIVNESMKRVKDNPLGGPRKTPISYIFQLRCKNLLRAVEEVPLHLVNANRKDDFWDICCTMKWICLKLCLTSAKDLADDFRNAASLTNDQDVTYISDAIVSVVQRLFDTNDKLTNNKLITFAQGVLCRMKSLSGVGSPCVHKFLLGIEEFIEETSTDELLFYPLNSWVPCHSMFKTKIQLAGDAISCLSVTEDREFMVCAYQNGLIELRNLPEGNTEKTWILEKGPCLRISFNNKNNKIFCVSKDCFAMLDMRSGDVLKLIEFDDNDLLQLHTTSIGYILCHFQKSAQLYNLQTDSFSHQLHIKDNCNIACLCLSQIDELFTMDDGEVALIDEELEKVINSNNSPSNSDPGPCIIAGFDNGNIQVWSIESQKSIKYFSAHSKKISFIESLPEFRIVSVSHARSIRVHNWLKGRMIHRTLIPATAGHPYNYIVRTDHLQKYIAITGSQRIHIWEMQELKPLDFICCHAADITDMQFSDIGTTEEESVPVLLTLGEDYLCKLWSISQENEIMQISIDSTSIATILYNYILVANKEDVYLYLYSSVSLQNPPKYYNTKLKQVAYSSISSCVAIVGANDHSFLTYDITTGKTLSFSSEKEEAISHIGFCTAQEQLLLYICSDCNNVTIYNSQTLKPWTCFFLCDSIYQVTSHQDMHVLLFVSTFGRLILFDAENATLKKFDGIFSLPKVMTLQLISHVKALLFLAKQAKIFIVDMKQGSIVIERYLSEQHVSAMSYCESLNQFAFSKGGPSIWVLDMYSCNKAKKLSTIVNGCVTHLAFMKEQLVVVDSWGLLYLLDIQQDLQLTRIPLEGHVDWLIISSNKLVVVVDRSVALLELKCNTHSNRKHSSNTTDENFELIPSVWKTLNNSVGVQKGYGAYLGNSNYEKIKWGQETSPLPLSCTIL